MNFIRSFIFLLNGALQFNVKHPVFLKNSTIFLKTEKLYPFLRHADQFCQCINLIKVTVIVDLFVLFLKKYEKSKI